MSTSIVGSGTIMLISRKIRKLSFSLVIAGFLWCVATVQRTPAQNLPNLSQPASGRLSSAADKALGLELDAATSKKIESSAGKKSTSTDERLNALEQALETQNAKLDQLQKIIADQQQPAQPSAVEDRLKKVEARVAEIGAIKFSGDIRLRAESFFGLSNSLSNGDNPAILGNDLSPRHRMRLRARLQMRGAISDEFDWGLRFATGSFADNISTNQTLTDFFNRKPFALDQAFITYKPRRAPGLRLQGGRFEPPWTFTEMTIDNDLMVDGFNESYSRAFKKSTLKDLTLVAWQLPLLERNSAFVRNSNGTVNIDQSRRGGRDLAVYGAQVRARFEPSSKVALNLSLADLYFSGTQFISPVQVFGSQL